MKIFEIKWTSQGESEWIAADNVIHALKVYCSITDMDISDFSDDDEIIEVPKKNWSDLTVKEEDAEDAITFKQWMKENKGPDIIAGTMYEI